MLLLTQNHGDGFHQVDHRLVVVHLRGVLRHGPALALHVVEDTSVHGHHNEESEQVEDCPEDQKAAAVEGRDGGAVVVIAFTVPKDGGHQTHDDSRGPDANYEQHHPPLGHVAVQLHGYDGLVALHGDGEQVGYRRS